MDEPLSPWQIKRLEQGIGCVQCGALKTKMTTGGHQCCCRRACREYLLRLEGRLGLDDLFTHELAGTKLRDLD